MAMADALSVQGHMRVGVAAEIGLRDAGLLRAQHLLNSPRAKQFLQ
jgi:hypothetical protein